MSDQPLNILVLEDDDGDFLLLRKALERTQMKVQLTNAQTLKEAVTHINNNRYDVILSDLSLPDSQGIETVEQLLETNTLAPIIVLTGLKDEKIGLTAIRQGAQDYLNKGEITDDLIKRVIRYAVERKGLDRMKDDFVSSVSHELRTPLTVIKERISQVQDGILGETTEKQQKAMAAASRNIERLESIINNLLDIAKINAGKMELHKDTVNMAVLIKEVCDALEFKAKEKNLELRPVLSSDNIEIKVDKTKIYQVLVNLINNAIKFTEQGYIEILIDEFPEKIQLSVKDTGRGMSSENLKKLFNKFEQFGSANQTTEKGSGLGLAIVKGLIELHNGRISAESEVNAGSTFSVELPK